MIRKRTSPLPVCAPKKPKVATQTYEQSLNESQAVDDKNKQESPAVKQRQYQDVHVETTEGPNKVNRDCNALNEKQAEITVEINKHKYVS